MFLKRFSTITVCLLLVACSQQKVLYSDLSEIEANEMVALLYSSNLTATKVESKNGLYRVDVEQSSFSNSVSLLQAHGLPRERFESLGEVFTKDGFVSSPLEERARLNYALSQEIAQTISSIDGVVVARVHLAVPQRKLLADSVDPSSASVFVKHRSEIDMGVHVGKIKSLVVTGFENLPYENVTVGLFPIQPSQSVENRIDEKPVQASIAYGNWPQTLWIMFFIVLGIALLAVGIGLFLTKKKA